MNAVTIATVAGIILIGELPDKTFIANLVMSTRQRPAPVWVGSALAFTVHVAIAVAAGSVLTKLPHRTLEIVVAALFTAGALVLLLGRENSQMKEGEEEAEQLDSGSAQGSGGVARRAMPRRSGKRVALIAFTIIFTGEWGDLTQILIANFSAKYHQPYSVGIGALAGLLIALTLAVVSGRALLRVLPLAVIRKLSGVILLGFATWSIVSAVRAG